MERTQTPNLLNDQQELIIYLRILGGIHFQQDKLGRKVGLVASLNQQQLDGVSSRPVTPGSGTANFDCRFVWACTRLDLKDMKTKNVPIKLDCCEIQPTGARCHIGSVVIQLRSIPVVTLARTNSIKPRWYRLIGLENERWRRTKPELHVLAMVTSAEYLNQRSDKEDISPASELNVDEHANPAAQCTTIYTEPKPSQLPSNVRLVQDRALLQIGTGESDVDLFLFEVVLKCGQHLDHLLPGADSFRLRYELYGEKYLSLAERKAPGSAVFDVKEKISIHVRSSLETLAEYFTACFNIAVEVLPNDDDPKAHGIGKASIDFLGFVCVRQLEEFKEKYATKNNTLETVRSIAIHDAGNTEQNHRVDDNAEEKSIVPLLKCKFSLKYLGSDRPPLESEASQKPRMESVAMQTPQDATFTAQELTQAKKQESCESLPKPSTPHPARTNRDEGQERVDIGAILMTTGQDLRDIRRTFAFRVRVGTVKFTSSPSPGTWQVALQHTKADTPFTRATLELLPDVAVHADRIEFGDLALELLFSTLPDRVVETIGAEPSKLTLNGPHGAYALARLDNESLLVGTRENQPSGVLVMVNEAGENVAIASVSCMLAEVGLNYNSQLATAQDNPCCHRAGPSPASAFNETIAYQLVEEQKAWMGEQREQFIVQLKQKEHKHLQTLAQNWKERRAEAEKRLAERLTHADALTASLEEARRKLETHVPHDTTRIKQLEQLFRSQLEDIRAKAVRLNRDAEAQIETTRRQCSELQQQLAELAADQQHLLDRNRELRNELDQEQTERAQQAIEFKHQLDDANNSKQYYKEQWAKQTRKLHQLEQELSLARTPYFQPPAIGRKGRRKGAGDGGAGSQVSMVRSQGEETRRGAGDCCQTCDCHTGPNCSD
uniref:DUF3668 domain-containing protein n=1 Tax=Anopheles dirus TaxID=7168 RepID=A0A182N6F4_9DIPT